ncbi:MAG: exosortase/archaeosortase family protein [Candidatus Omnitrophica bacterium]|nr:exosortase/archaeosortase family protein [Candidatus Omnitrophota bacterium]
MNKKNNIIVFAVSWIILLIAYIPTIGWMVQRWMAAESYYGHGILIPLVSLFIVWQRRDVLKNSKIASEFSGLIIVAINLFIHIVCAALKVYFVSGVTFVFALYGLILFFFGKEITRKLIFPVFFLLTMVPLPLVAISGLTVKLKLFAAQMAAFILNRIGFPCIRDGSLIRMPKSFISVEAPCSGLRSLISLLTLGLLFAYAMKVAYWKKAILFLSAIPIAIISNIIRIILLATVNDLYGEKIAMGFFHDFTGFFVFAFAFTALFGVSKVLEIKQNE